MGEWVASAPDSAPPKIRNLCQKVYCLGYWWGSFCEKQGCKWGNNAWLLRVVGGFEYLTTVIDLYDRKVVGYSISRTMRASDTVIPALKMAIKRRLNGRSAPGLIVHSDRGVQYTCSECTELLAKNKMVRSNSRKGDCWDNAVAESFFKTLKCELIYQFKQLLPAETMRTE